MTENQGFLHLVKILKRYISIIEMKLRCEKVKKKMVNVNIIQKISDIMKIIPAL